MLPAELMSEPRNPTLMSAAQSYTRAATEWIASRNPPELPTLQSQERWVRLGERTFFRRREIRILWLGAISRCESALHELQEYGAAVRALTADPVIGPQLGRVVGSVGGGSATVTAADILRTVLSESFGKQLECDDVAFAAAYMARERELYSEAIVFETVAPVAGLADAPSMCFGELELGRITDEDAQCLLNTGLLQCMGDEQWATANTEFVLRRREILPRRIVDGAVGPPDTPPGGPTVRGAFLDVLTALRLLRNGSVSLPGMVTKTATGRMWSPLAPMPPISDPKYILNASDVDDLTTLWQLLQTREVRERAFIQTAIRRFTYSGERVRVEDRFIDLMIAAEAMFLGEKRKGETAGELTVKISTRFAHFAPIPHTTRLERYRFMKDAYGARSSIVHGDRPKNLPTAEAIEAFTNRTADYLRLCLRKMMDQARTQPDAKPLVEWDELVFGP